MATGAAVEIGTAQVGHGAYVLVATAREVDQDRLVRAHGLGHFVRRGPSRAGFGGRDVVLGRRRGVGGDGGEVEGMEGVWVGDVEILGAADLLQPGMLGAYARVVQARADAVGFGD